VVAYRPLERQNHLQETARVLGRLHFRLLQQRRPVGPQRGERSVGKVDTARTTSSASTPIRAFTQDGSQQIALGEESRALHVWDLRLLRQELAELGLDWEQPSYPLRNAMSARRCASRSIWVG
jgi:hypothetical protein